MLFIKHLITWLLLLTVITASGIVSAKVASGSQNLSSGLHQENITANALLHLAKIEFSYDGASGSPVATKRTPSIGGGGTLDKLSPGEIKRIQNGANRSGSLYAVWNHSSESSKFIYSTYNPSVTS